MNKENDILINGLRKGDYASFNRLFHIYYGRLCTFVTQIIHDDKASEDIIQELYIKLWTNREKMEIRENLVSYLFRSARNGALNYLRNEATRKNATEMLQNNKVSPSIDDQIEQQEFLNVLNKCIAQLPPRSREVFLLSRFEGLKQQEISDKLNISVKTIKNQIWKSLQYLKSCIGHKESEQLRIIRN